jgi:hypothetical protein
LLADIGAIVCLIVVYRRYKSMVWHKPLAI